MLSETHLTVILFFESSYVLLRIQGYLYKAKGHFFQRTWSDVALTLRERINKMSTKETPQAPIEEAFSVPLPIPLAHAWLQPQLYWMISRELRHLPLLASSDFGSAWRPSLRQQDSFNWKYSLEMQNIEVPAGNAQPIEAACCHQMHASTFSLPMNGSERSSQTCQLPTQLPQSLSLTLAFPPSWTTCQAQKSLTQVPLAVVFQLRYCL